MLLYIRVLFIRVFRSYRYGFVKDLVWGFLLVFIYLSFYGVWTSVMLGAVIYMQYFKPIAHPSSPCVGFLPYNDCTKHLKCNHKTRFHKPLSSNIKG